MEKNDLKKLIAQDKNHLVFDVFSKNENLSNEQKSRIALLEFQYNKINHSIINNTISSADAFLFNNRITHSLLVLVDRFDKQGLLANTPKSEEVLENVKEVRGKWLNFKVTPFLCLIYFIFAFQTILLIVSTESLVEKIGYSLLRIFIVGISAGIIFSQTDKFKSPISAFKITFPIPVICFFLISPIFVMALLEARDIMFSTDMEFLYFFAINIILNSILGFFFAISTYYGVKLGLNIAEYFYSNRLSAFIESNDVHDFEVPAELSMLKKDRLKIRIIGITGIIGVTLIFLVVQLFRFEIIF